MTIASELKTLKDFPLEWDCFDYSEGRKHLTKELRAEAVKWVKHFKELDKNRILNDSINRYFNSGQLRFVVEFFNLTEEDLK